MASTRHSVVEEAPADSIDEHFAIKDSFHKLQLAEQPVIAGALKKLSPKRLGPFLSWQSRYCVLMPVCGHFRYYKSEEKFAKDGEPSGIIPLNTVSEVKRESPLRFKLVVAGGRVFTFSSKSPNTISDWVKKIQACLKGLATPPHDITTASGKKFWKPQQFADAMVDPVSYLAETPFSHFMSVPELRAFSQYFAVSKEQVGAPLIFNSPRKHSYSRSSTSKASVKAGKILGGSEYATWGDMKINIATRNDMRSKPCSKFILIIEGRVSIYSGSKRLCTKTAGQFIPMVNEVDRPLLCKCVTDCVLISMSEEALNSYSQDHPKHTDLVNRFMGRTQVEELQRLALFKAVPLDELYLVQCLLGWHVLLPGEVLFREGSLCASLYIMVTGRCTAHAFGDGRESNEHEEEEEKNKKSPQAASRRFTGVLGGLMPGRKTRQTTSASIGKEGGEKQVWSAPERELSRKRTFLSVSAPAGPDSTEPSEPVPTADEQLGKTLHTFRHGDFFGEVSVMINMPRTVSIASESVSVLYELTKSDFETFISFYPLDSHLHEFAQQSVASHFMKYDIPFFQSIPRSKFGLLAKLSRVQEYEGGKTVFMQGDTGDSFYIIAHGEVGCYIKPEHDPDLPAIERKVATLARGKYFGELALVRDAPRCATVRCLCRCVMLVITRENFRKFFQDTPQALADFEIRVSADNISLRTLLYHPVGFKFFHRHCQSEYSTENINFWAECDEFKRFTYSSVLEAEQERTGSHYRLLNWRNELKELVDSFTSGQGEQANLMRERVKRMIEYDYSLCRSTSTSDEDFALLLEWYREKYKEVKQLHMERLERFLIEGRTMNAFKSALDEQSSGYEQQLLASEGGMHTRVTNAEKKKNFLSCFWLLCALRDEAAVAEAKDRGEEEGDTGIIADVEAAYSNDKYETDDDSDDEYATPFSTGTNGELTSADIHRGVAVLCEVDKWGAGMIEDSMRALEGAPEGSTPLWTCQVFCDYLTRYTSPASQTESGEECGVQHLWLRALGQMCQSGRVAYQHELYAKLARVREDGKLYVTINDLCVALSDEGGMEESLTSILEAPEDGGEREREYATMKVVQMYKPPEHKRRVASISLMDKANALVNDEALLDGLKHRFDDQGMMHAWNRLEGLTYCEHMTFLVRDNLRSNKFRWFLANKARSIYETYICTIAPNPVNIKSSQKDALDSMFGQAEDLRVVLGLDISQMLGLFDTSQHEILKLMERDTLKRFKHSESFKQFKAEAQVGEYNQNTLEKVNARIEKQKEEEKLRQKSSGLSMLSMMTMKARSVTT